MVTDNLVKKAGSRRPVGYRFVRY